MLRDFPDTAWYALGPDGKQLVLNGRDGTLTLWRTDSASQETRFETGNGWFGSLALSADGKLLFGAGGNTYALWDVKRVSMLARLEGFGFRSRTCAFSPDGGRVAVGGGAGNVHILRLENREAPAG